jgi:hypothetical protein
MTKTPSVDFKTYLFSYELDGASWVFELKASDPEDAQRRIRRIQHASYDGELKAKIVVPSFLNALTTRVLGFFERAIPSRRF